MHMVETVWMRRRHWYYRAQFILTIGLFAIFCRVVLWGLKTPAVSLAFLQENGEDDELVVYYWSIQKRWRAFLWLQRMDQFVNILFVYYSTNSWCSMVEWLAKRPMSLGTWVRIPGPPKNLIAFVFQVFLWGLPKKVYHMPHKSGARWLHAQIQRP